MKLLFKSITIILVFELIALSCANPMTPTGGPKDSIPPTLLESNPVDQQLNFKGQTITLEFDEVINADKLQQNLVITPTTETKYKTIQKKYSVTLQFEEPFEDSTTYTFNFFDGITDITEKTPAENLIIAFSTGSYIDSLYLSGQVLDLLTGEPKDKITVGLYIISDTLDFEVNKPTYFSTTNEEGQFFLQNIKASKFRMLAFGDDNRNLIFDAATESYAIKSDTIDMRSQSGDTLSLNAIQINAAALEYISARPSGRYFEIRYSKPLVEYSIQNTDSLNIASKLVDENKTIRVYDNKSFTDSLFSILYVKDSLGNTSTDTTYIQFRESSRKPEAFTMSLLPAKNSQVTSTSRYKLSFNKPTEILSTDFLDVVYDTLVRLDYQPRNVVYSNHNLDISFDLDISLNNYKDSLTRLSDAIVIDSTNIDTAQMELKKRLTSINQSNFSLQILPKSFQSVELDSSAVLNQNYKFLKQESLGLIEVTLNTDSTHFIVQLMNKKEVVASQTNTKHCVFNNLPPANYWVRILIDSNQNGKWDVGNYRENIAPEPVFYFKEETTLRANFENQLEFSF